MDEPFKGLVVHVKTDGTWLEFKASGGKSAMLHIEALADKYKIDGGRSLGVIAATLHQWSIDRQEAALAAVPAVPVQGATEGKVDWGKPIEAVDWLSGRVCNTVVVKGYSFLPANKVLVKIDGIRMSEHRAGESLADIETGYVNGTLFIRNKGSGE